ncbi:unnamed protein product [Mytilus edulis]|uniref:Uncharacterized protein n=1 Tax=Mytilus edulis TaxID=6550 RepID=A0A8S3T7I7_MYTED|nr:unnamed protein product [Mytilus edulis]
MLNTVIALVNQPSPLKSFHMACTNLNVSVGNHFAHGQPKQRNIKKDRIRTRNNFHHRHRSMASESEILQTSSKPSRSEENVLSDNQTSHHQNGGHPYQKLPHLYDSVSNWTIQMVEKYLHIFYTGEGMEYSGEYVLQQGGIKTELTTYQKEYMTDLESILTFNGSMYTYKYRSKTKAKPMLQTILNKVSPQNTSNLKDRPIYRYLHNVAVFVKYMLKYVDKVQETEWFNNKIPEGFYTELVGRFAEMCLLITNYQPEKSVWKNFKGITVKSKPDLRFFKSGIDDIETETAFAVIEVKRDIDTDEICQSAPPKRMKRSLSSGSQSDSTNSSPPTRRQQRNGTSTLADKVKGQHAGELLLDLHSIKKKKDLVIAQNITCRVSITMLVISRSHYEKIERNEPLDPEDKAQIYVSFFYDFLNQDERNELMRVFMMLNNIPEIYSEPDDNDTGSS